MAFEPSWPRSPLLRAARQVIVVTSEGGSRARLERFERVSDSWATLPPAWPAVVGAGGFAAPDVKREGDTKTPSGVWRIDYAFGDAPRIDTKLAYRQATADDKFIDDPSAPDYNAWVCGPTHARSFETMLRTDGLYEFGLVLRYNVDPVIPGHGSAIFLHVWPGPEGHTAGCVAIERQQMLELLRWLDPALNPCVLLNPVRTSPTF